MRLTHFECHQLCSLSYDPQVGKELFHPLDSQKDPFRCGFLSVHSFSLESCPRSTSSRFARIRSLLHPSLGALTSQSL